MFGIWYDSTCYYGESERERETNLSRAKERNPKDPLTDFLYLVGRGRKALTLVMAFSIFWLPLSRSEWLTDSMNSPISLSRRSIALRCTHTQVITLLLILRQENMATTPLIKAFLSFLACILKRGEKHMQSVVVHECKEPYKRLLNDIINTSNIGKKCRKRDVMCWERDQVRWVSRNETRRSKCHY